MAYKAIFLDRDDTLIEDPGYINDADMVRLLPGAVETLASLSKMGYKLVVVTNQSAVARGIISEEVLEQIHQRMEMLLAREGVSLDAIYYCPYHPDGVIGKYRRDSDLRKPNPGMILAAARDLNIDLNHSWMIGNSYSDITAGSRAGCRTVLISSSAKPPEKSKEDHDPDKIAVNIKEAANIIKMYERTKRTVRPRRPRNQQATASSTSNSAQEATADSRSSLDRAIDNIIDESASADAGASVRNTAVVQVEAAKEQPAATIVEKVERASASKRSENKTVNQAAAGNSTNTRLQAHSSAGAPEEDSASVEESDESATPTTTREVLEEVMRYLKKLDRLGMYDEFSIIKVLAGVAQVVVLFCLLLSVWFLMDPTREEASVHTILGYAVVLQLMVIAFYLMRDRR